MAIKTADISQDFRRIADLVIGGEKVLVSRPHNENLMVITEKEYNELDKLRRNEAYLNMLKTSIKEAEDGDVVEYSMDSLNALIEG